MFNPLRFNCSCYFYFVFIFQMKEKWVSANQLDFIVYYQIYQYHITTTIG